MDGAQPGGDARLAGPGADRTEKATPKRRDEARRRGQVARSREINTGLGVLATFGMLSFAGGWLLTGFTGMMTTSLARSGDQRPTIDRPTGWNAMMDAGWDTLRLTAPFAVAGVVVGIVASAIQVKPGITIEVLKPRFSVLNPVSGSSACSRRARRWAW